MAGEQVLNPDVARAMKGLLGEVTHNGTARRPGGAYLDNEGQPVATGGDKTSTGDNRMVTVNAGRSTRHQSCVEPHGNLCFLSGRTRHFPIHDRFCAGRDAADFKFTSALPVQVLKSMAPTSPLDQRRAGV